MVTAPMSDDNLYNNSQIPHRAMLLSTEDVSTHAREISSVFLVSALLHSLAAICLKYVFKSS